MRASVIVDVNAAGEWLEKVLWAYVVQSERTFELILVEDRTTPLSQDLCRRIERKIDAPLLRIDGDSFALKNVRMKNAVLKAQSDYLIFTQADCIPPRDFIKNHLSFARPKRFIAGSEFMIPRSQARLITRMDIVSGNAMRPEWLLDQGLPFSTRLSTLQFDGALATLLDRVSFIRPGWHGYNSSIARDDLLAVDGFEEGLCQNSSHSDLGRWLEKLGTKGEQAFHRCSVLRLESQGDVIDSVASEYSL